MRHCRFARCSSIVRQFPNEGVPMPRILFFPYFGPSRRSEKRVVEIRLEFSADDESVFPQQVSDIRSLLIRAGILDADEKFPEQTLADEKISWYSSLLAQTAILFQRKTGHRVQFCSIAADLAGKRCIALVEHEDSQVGMAAVKLAIELFSGGLKDLAGSYRLFSELAVARLLPFETEAIINELQRSDIPYFQLEREPLAGRMKTGVRIRRNGLLSLGHGTGTQMLDGTFCLDRAGDFLKALSRNPAQRMALLKQLQIPITVNDTDRKTGAGLFHLLVVNSKVTALEEEAEGNRRLITNVHESIIKQIRAISERVDQAPIVVTLQAADLSSDLVLSGGGVVDFELAPDLYGFIADCKDGPGLLTSAAADLVEWLYPDPATARIPIVAVTGTNGKTTTTHMIHHVFQMAGSKSGLVCTDGIFLGEQRVSDGDASAFVGHARVLTSKQVDVAVLEAHHRGMAVRGFAFQNCDVAVCLNVTPDHLFKGEIETIEEMVEIKRSLLERARDAAVLNADDPRCLSMRPFLKASRVCLFSSSQDRKTLAELVDSSALFCLVEAVDGEEWVFIYDGDEKHRVLPVSDMPCTFAGMARFNLENALAAIASCYLMGVSLESIRGAMASFMMGYEHTPGRLNFYYNLPFSAVMDFAHNPDGLARLTDFTSGFHVDGRRLLILAGPGDRDDEALGDMARVVAGKCDYYICRTYPNLRGRKPGEVARILRTALLAAGVPDSAIAIESDSSRAIERILAMAGPSDLVILPLSRNEFEATHQRLLVMQSGVKTNDRN